MTDVGDAGPGDALAILADQFGQLAVQLAGGVDQPLTQQRLVEFAVRGVPGAEHASMTMVEQNRPPRTTAGSDELPYRWDELQYEHGEGPAWTRSSPTVSSWCRTCGPMTGGRGSPGRSWRRPRRGAS